jgi:hypothetical protein
MRSALAPEAFPLNDHPGQEAWHEAGHALAALHYGGEVRFVTLESELEGHEGHTEVAWRGLARPERLRRSALVALAGPVAETLYLGEDVENPRVLSSWAGDWAEADSCLADLVTGSAERGGLRDRLIAELVALFREDRALEQLARIADALDAHGTLDAALLEEAAG